MQAPQKVQCLVDPAEVRKTLAVLLPAGQVTELRILDGTTRSDHWPATLSGYFDDAEKLIAALSAVSSAKGIYIIPNPVNPDLLARAYNRLRKSQKGDATSDKAIVARSWLLIDCDYHRAAGISASDAEHELALRRAAEIAQYLTTLGWPKPVVADSGNGGHLLYRIDLPAEDEGLVAHVLSSLAEKFGGDDVKVDTTVSNAARIWKLYGTLACKGDNIPSRPHRLSRLLEMPQTLKIVSSAQLNLIASEQTCLTATTNQSAGLPYIDGFIERHQLDVSEPQSYEGGRSWTLKTSPLCEHGGDGPFLIERANGALAAGCHHNSCSWNWHDLRNKLEPKPSSTKARGAKTSLNRELHKDLSPPSPIFTNRPPGFPVHVLPESARSYVSAAAEAIGCDPSYIALPLLACLAEVIGNRRVIQLKKSWTEPAIIWAAIIGKSGSAKSPALSQAIRFLQEIQETAFESYAGRLAFYKDAAARYERDYANWKKSKSDVDPPEQPQEPACERFITSDATVEALANLLAKQENGVLVIRDELAGWINGIAEYKGGKGSDLGHWLACWSAQSLTVDRKTGAIKTIYVPRASVSIVGGIQPGILRTALGREHMQDGLCARLLMAMPEARSIKWSERVIEPKIEAMMRDVFANLSNLEPVFDEYGRAEPVKMTLTPEAKELWIDYFNRHRDEMVKLEDDTSSAWSKLEAYTARFALIFQLCDWAAGMGNTHDFISAQAVEMAIQLSDWFGAESQRVYAVLAETEEERDGRELVELVRRHGGKITPRELAHSCRRYRQSGVAESVLEDLVKSGWGRWDVRVSPRGGAPSRMFILDDSGNGNKTPESREIGEVVLPLPANEFLTVFPEDTVNRLFAEAVDEEMFAIA